MGVGWKGEQTLPLLLSALLHLPLPPPTRLPTSILTTPIHTLYSHSVYVLSICTAHPLKGGRVALPSHETLPKPASEVGGRLVVSA